MEVLIALIFAVPLAVGLIEWRARQAAKQDYQEYLAKFMAFHKDSALNAEESVKPVAVTKKVPWEV